MSSEEDIDEWRPPEPNPKGPSKPVRAAAAGVKKIAAKRTTKPREPKTPKEPKAPKVTKCLKPRAPRKSAAEQKTRTSVGIKEQERSVFSGMKIKTDLGKNTEYSLEDTKEKQPYSELMRTEENGPPIRMKEEVRLIPIY